MATADDRPDVNPFSAEDRLSGEALEQALDAAPVIRTEHRESLLTRMIEQQTTKIPSNAFLFLSMCAMAVSLGAELTGRRRISRFVGMWAGPLLTLGLYNKMVKTFGTR